MQTKLVSIITVILFTVILAPAAHADARIVGKVLQKVTGDGKTLEDGLLVDANGAYLNAGGRVIVFLVGYPKYADCVDDDSVLVMASPAGTFSYTTTEGATKTVHKFKYFGPISPGL